MSAGTTSTASGTVGVAVNEGGGVNVLVAIDADVADCVLFPQALKIAITITKRMMDRKRTVFLQVRDAGIELYTLPLGIKKDPRCCMGLG
jgi:hypothetical protein